MIINQLKQLFIKPFNIAAGLVNSVKDTFNMVTASGNALRRLINVINGVKNGKSDEAKVSDGIMLVAAMLKVAGLIWTVATPFLAPIAAVVGVIGGLVSMFRHDKPKDSHKKCENDPSDQMPLSLPTSNELEDTAPAEHAPETAPKTIIAARGVAFHQPPPSTGVSIDVGEAPSPAPSAA